jgi:hypothetical protein
MGNCLTSFGRRFRCKLMSIFENVKPLSYVDCWIFCQLHFSFWTVGDRPRIFTVLSPRTSWEGSQYSLTVWCLVVLLKDLLKYWYHQNNLVIWGGANAVFCVSWTRLLVLTYWISSRSLVGDLCLWEIALLTAFVSFRIHFFHCTYFFTTRNSAHPVI